jgi:hypothetical protein
MAKSNLARLESVPLRAAWASESSDFTPWLADAENLKLLGDAIGLDLELEKREQAVDQYRADIVCRELENNQRVVIENQIEETDHKHLGQILTYAAGVNASILIWVAQKFTDAHRAAVSWLNEQANGNASYFAIEIELYRIGNSLPAPRFNVVSKPNDWANNVKKSVDEAGLSESEQIRLRYWIALAESLKMQKSNFDCYKPTEKSWLKIKLPFSGYSAGFEYYLREGKIGVYFGSFESKNIETLRRIVQADKTALEKEVGGEIELTDNGENKRFWIEILDNSNLNKESDWPRQHQ